MTGIPFFAAWCLERISNPVVRLGTLIGAGLGIPLSYFAQPASVQMAMSLPLYLTSLIESLEVWHHGNVADFLRFTLPMWMTSLATAVAGAMAARFFPAARARRRLPNRLES